MKEKYVTYSLEGDIAEWLKAAARHDHKKADELYSKLVADREHSVCSKYEVGDSAIPEMRS